jgi:hypothetical protein
MSRDFGGTCREWVAGLCGVVAAVALVIASWSGPTQASGISGTLSNFDTFNDTPSDAYGAEIELEGISSTDIVGMYPSHYNNKTKTDYSELGHTGARLVYDGYNFDVSGFLAANTPVQNTNGHMCVNLAGCEHFGFSVSQQPTATRFYWLDQNGQRINTMPASIPNPTWNYVPPAPGVPAHLAVAIEPPEPPEVHPQLPDSIWMKMYVTEIEREVELDELTSGAGSIVEQSETEIEWELLEGGVMKEDNANFGENVVAVIRRYEFFKYTGPVNPEDNEAQSTWDGIGDPPASELGDFIAANMVAVNLQPVPEPASGVLCLSGIGLLWLVRRRR